MSRCQRCLLAVAVLASLGVAVADAQARAGGAAQKPDPIEINNGVVVRGKYVSLLVGTAAATATPGGRVGLLIKVSPGPKMHVYAPGQEGYIPAAMSLEPNPAFSTRAVVYPAPTPFAFVPLGETVKVYSAPFVLSQDVVLASSLADLTARAAKGEAFSIAGTFAYQACDDKVCYRPETLNVKWTVTLKPAAR